MEISVPNTSGSGASRRDFCTYGKIFSVFADVLVFLHCMYKYQQTFCTSFSRFIIHFIIFSMKKLFSLSFALSFLLCFGLQAQGVMKFEKETHDFGTIEEGSIASYDFEFTNKGNQPIIINSVTASCGCTTPFYTREPIMPGKKGKITVSFNSNGRPNAFNKAVTIKSNTVEDTKIIWIKGMVNPKSTQNAVANGRLGKLEINKSSHDFGNIAAGQSVVEKFILKNTGTADILISGLHADCRCVSHSIQKANLAPGESTVLELRYAPKGKNKTSDAVSIYSNAANSSLRLELNALVNDGNMMREGKQVSFGF